MTRPRDEADYRVAKISWVGEVARLAELLGKTELPGIDELSELLNGPSGSRRQVA